MIVVCFPLVTETLATLERLEEGRNNERGGGDENRKKKEREEGREKEKEKERERICLIIF